jgi:hypothetical protein
MDQPTGAAASPDERAHTRRTVPGSVRKFEHGVVDTCDAAVGDVVTQIGDPTVAWDGEVGVDRP